MQRTSMTQFERIKQAIGYLREHYLEQPSLDTVAAYVGLSPSHMQRVFVEWAGVSPKTFLQYLSLNHAKTLLARGRSSVLHAALDSGLSGAGRLHDLFVQIEGMTPGEFKSGGQGLRIDYHFSQTPFGRVIVAATGKGVCHMAFCDDAVAAVSALKNQFPRADVIEFQRLEHEQAVKIFEPNWQDVERLKLHLRATPFQLKVWQCLLSIPEGATVTYGDVAAAIGQPKAARAVGTAIGRNPVAFVIPCHRVIQQNGQLGQYMWGADRKSAMIGWESVRNTPQ